jgi:sec-independent protein translocase protein TatB
MFDVGFSEMLVIAVVALVVIGPERLPGVARTLGHLLGRLQRYVGDVKSDIQREMQLEELKKLQSEVTAQAMDIERKVVGEMKGVEQAVAEPVESLAEVMKSTGTEVESTLAEFDPLKDVPPQTLPPPAEPATAVAADTPVAPTPARPV